MLLSRQPGVRLLARAASSCTRGAASVAEPVETAATAPVMPPCEFTPLPYDGPSREEVLSLRKRFLSPALFHHFKEPIMLVEGKQQWLFDETGRRYLDAFAGIVTVSVGHCHPEVVRAVDEQNKRLQHTTTIYLNDQIAMYAKELTDRLPGDLKVAFFVNSGSEANDLAMKMARLYSGSYDFLALRNGYHGKRGLNAHSTWRYNMPQGFGVHYMMNPDPYRGPFGNDGSAYAAQVKDTIQFATPGRVAGFIHETIQGVGGSVQLADGFLSEAYQMVTDAGGLNIADEVQTGFGRTGSHFWGFQTQARCKMAEATLGVMPDIVTMAKGIGNGLPLAAVVTTPQIAEVLAPKLFLNTFGGNPVCCAGGRAVLRVIDNEGIQANCAKVGPYLVSRFRELQQKHDIIGDVRGKGLMLGLELVRDRKTMEPAGAETAQIMERMREMGVLIGKGGLYGNVFRVKPPMCWTLADADYLVDVMDIAMSEL